MKSVDALAILIEAFSGNRQGTYIDATSLLHLLLWV